MKNSEKYKTVEERASAFKRFCDDMHKKHISGPCPSCPAFGNQCAFRWLDLEAEEEKPQPCPFCGWDSIDIFETDFGQNEEPYQFAVKCKSCGALVSAEDKDDAIAAWNRRVK